MTQLEQHHKFLQKVKDVSLVKHLFKKEDYLQLQKYGAWMEALHLKKIKPITKSQEEFCTAMDLDDLPEHPLHRLFWIYINRLRLNETMTFNNTKRLVPDERDQLKKMRNTYTGTKRNEML